MFRWQRHGGTEAMVGGTIGSVVMRAPAAPRLDGAAPFADHRR